MGDLNVSRMSEDGNKLTGKIPHLAKESDKIRKTREKLKQKLEDNQPEITKEGLKAKIEEIHGRIARLAALRVFVEKGGSLSLFNNNQNPAPNSTRVAKYAEGILNSWLFKPEKRAPESLKNRSIEAQ